MMHNKNIYKKLCTATISLGLLFSIGQFAYAHDPNLYAAEKLAASNPTLENLTHLRSLYEIDIQQHYVKGENDEAKEAEQELQKTQIQITSILSSEKAKAQEIYNKAIFTKYSEDCKCAVDCFDNLLKMLKISGDNSSLVAECCETFITLSNNNKELPLERVLLNKAMLALMFAKTNQSVRHLANTYVDTYLSYVKYCETFITLASDNKELALAVMNTEVKRSVAMVKLEQAETMLVYNKTPENYGILAQCYDALVEFVKSHPQYSNNLRWYQIQAAKARVHQQKRIISQNGRTPENCETLAQRYDKVSKLYNSYEEYTDAIAYKSRAIDAMLYIVDLTEKPNEKCNAYVKAIEHTDDAAAFAENFGLPNNTVLDFKIKAAKSRMNLAKIIFENNKPNLQNYDNWVRHCEELVQLFDENDRDNLRIDAAIARIDAAIARAKRAKFIAEQHKTVEAYDILIQCWNEVVENFEAFSATWAENMPHGLPEPPENIQGLEEARHEAELARDIHMYLMNEEEIFRQGTFLSIAALLGKK